MNSGILSYGAYIPMLRLSRQAIFQSNAWFNAGLKGLAKGERSLANWDEDSITMAVEATRDTLIGFDRQNISSLFMASTTYPFSERQSSAVVAQALNLSPSLFTADFSNSQRAGISTLMAALRMTGEGQTIVASAEMQDSQAASTQELTDGDGGAALLLGTGNVIAKCIAIHGTSADFVDRFRPSRGRYPYTWEERWTREEGHGRIAVTALKQLLSKSDIDASTINHFCFPAVAKKTAENIAQSVGIAKEAVVDSLQAECGFTGTTHPLLQLCATLEKAKPNERIMVVGFGQGCDAIIFETTAELTQLQAQRNKAGAQGYAKSILRRKTEDQPMKRLAFRDMIPIDRGMRAEFERAPALSTLYRNISMLEGMIGGCCTACNTKQFPQSKVCCNPDCQKVGTQVDQPFADAAAKLNSYTADVLSYCPDPPAYYGMVEFLDGGRMMMDITDINEPEKLASGVSMRMVFRIHDFDERRGLRRYFWKATPAQ